ncbi:hypothetical protein AMJ80_02555 [bacterium SM23_31]|nr:MAG: hypothetical protein AMJ80_02555 [bacterium SM23_31]
MSFINPLFLIAISTALLPIIYHLIRKLRARKIRFSSLIFLKATPKELIKKRRLRDLILLIVRSCILGFLAFAFARPFLPEEDIPFVAQIEDKSVVILIDNSYSMQYDDLFEQSLDKANELIDNAGFADELSIIVFSDEAEQVTRLDGDIGLQRDILRSMVNISNRATDFYKPITLAEEILKDAKHQKREIVLISDFQNYAWSSRFDNWNLDKNIKFIPEQISSDKPVNSYVAQFNRKVARSGEDVATEYDIQVEFQGKDPNRDYELSLSVNGKEVEKKKIETMKSDQVIFQQFNLKRGTYQGYVALEDDKLNIDNKYYFSYEIVDRPSILCIDESPSSEENDVFFLGNAFEMGDKSDYSFNTGNKSSLTRTQLINHDLVILTNLGSLTSQQLTNLKRYVEDGGTIVISPGGRINIQRFSNYLEEFGIGRADEIIEMLSLREIAIMGEYDQHHPIFSVFAETGAGDLFRPRFYKYIKINPDTSASVLATLNTEDPLLIERKLGGGKILIYASTFDKSWTDLPLTEIYVPFVYQLAKYAVTTKQRKTDFFVGEPIMLKGKSGEVWEVSAPGDKIFKVTMDETGTGYFRETGDAGNYIAAYGSEMYYFSVNVDTRESELIMRDAEEAYAAVAQPSEEVEQELKKAALAEHKLDEKRQKLWRYVILFVVLLLLFETYYANRQLNIKII